MPEYKPLPLPKDVLATLMQHAVEHLIPPSELLAISIGKRTQEPFLFDPSWVPAGGNEQTRFTRVLSQLYLRAPTKFDEVVPTVNGTRRKYFGRTAKEVSSTGSSNTSMRIPESPWFVSVNNPYDRKAAIVQRVMLGMGFSGEYAAMISALSYRSKATLPWPYGRFLP